MSLNFVVDNQHYTPNMTTHVFKPAKLRRYHILESISSKTFIPREYQVELLDCARKKSSIICLGTGAGKTFVAVMLIKEFSHQNRKSLTNDGKRTIFLAPSVPLVIQHAKLISDCTDLTVGQYSGSKVFNWSKDYWLNEAKKHQVLVMTPDIFKLILEDGLFPLSMFNLIIFDECHRSIQNVPYQEVMKFFDAPDTRPRILGLSASLVNNKCRPLYINYMIHQLESVLNSDVITANDLTSLCKYGSRPKESVFLYESYLRVDNDVQDIVNCLGEALFFLDSVNLSLDRSDYQHSPCRQPRRYLVEFSYVLMNLGLWCSFKAVDLLVEEIDTILETIKSSVHKNFLVMTRTVLVTVQTNIQSVLDKNDLVSNLLESIPPKLKILLYTLEPYKPDETLVDLRGTVENDTKKETLVTQIEVQHKNHRSDRPRRNKNNTSPDDNKALCGLVFVHQRLTAFLLSEWLSAVKEKCPNLSFVSPCYIIGHGKNTSTLRNASVSLQRQDDVLQKFRTKLCNLIIATSVVEEGMDIPKCNLVIRFDPPENFRAYIQSKARTRVNDSSYVMLVKASDKELNDQMLSDYKATEELLLKKCHEVDKSIDDEIFENNIDDLMEPYQPIKEEGSAKVTLSSAIASVNRYCAKLPSDTFTRLTPKWKVLEDISKPGYFQCIMKLPINSPVKKKIIGQSMPSKQLSKMAVALQTCIELHKAGELDDNFLPTGKETVKSEDFFPDDHITWKKQREEDGNVLARPGSTKRRMYYFKKVADALKNSIPVASEPSFLYVFDMKLTCPIPDEQNTRGRKIHDPSDTVRKFGILTRNPIPPICNFPVFTRSGEVTISLKYSSENLVLSQRQIDSLAFFHHYTFSDVLRLEKYPMTYKPTDSEASFFVVPVTSNDHGSLVVDWNFVDLIYQERLEKHEKLTDDVRKNFKFVFENYQDAVVMPWYRNLDKPQFFYVAEICSNLTPLSDFPDQEYKSFKEYYKKKYDITIMNEKQPLLDVDHTSARLNLLTPRYVNRKGVTLPTSSEQTKKTKRENLQQKQILIPELCLVHPFPAYLWRKAVCLPCILYRLNSLLLAEQLRLQVANSICIGIRELPNEYEWPPLDFGWTLAEIITNQVDGKDFQVPKALEDSRVNTLPKIDDFSSSKSSLSGPSGPNSNTYRVENTCSNGIDFEIDVFDPSKINDFCKAKSSFKDQPDSNSNTSFEVENTCSNGMDFEIDVFDPSKVYIPDDDALLAQELEEMMGDISFGNGFKNAPISSFPIWQPITNGTVENGGDSPVRCGSPSFFEDSQWDMDWETDASFQPVNVRGLGYISAPGINMESLSMDLANCKDEAWDSLDEDSDLSDLEDDSNVIDSHKNQKQKQSKSFENTCENSWLTCTLYGTDAFDTPFCDEDVDLENPLIEELKEKKIREINYVFPPGYSTGGESVFSAFDDLHQKVLQSEKNIEPECILTNCDAELESNSPNFNDKSIVNGIGGSEQMLAFGELLPNRDSHQLYNNANRVSFDINPNLTEHPGPSPSIILQALSMSNANDGINLERLETVGDSFLKYAITVYLFCMYPNIHEGKLSYLRSKQISNFNLFKLGRKKGLGELMVATKFEPYDNWLPPNYIVPKGLEEALIESGIPSASWNLGNWNNLTQMNEDEIRELIIQSTQEYPEDSAVPSSSLVPYNLLTQQSIPDKSIADCVEALIGAYLVSCGSRGALLFMSWLGLRVLPALQKPDGDVRYGYLDPPKQPVLTNEPKSNLKLLKLLSGYSAFEKKIDYYFNDKTYLLQAFTHASYFYNSLTDCYQRLEFLGDAVLDYLITRHLYEDPKKHSPGTLTDLRSALVNNTFFASLAVKYDFHKFFKAISPGLFGVINKFVQLKERSTRIDDFLQAYYLEEDECEEMEDVEVPKALGDIFESVAGAIYLDSNMSLDTVWRVYYSMMKPEIEYFSTHVPKSPIRELLELEPQTAKFERAEMTVSGKVRVCVDVFGKGQFVGVGRNKRIAKCTAAKHALRELKKHKL